MKKLKLLFAAFALLLGVSNASADVTLSTDLTSQFVGLTNVSNWSKGAGTTSNPGVAGWAAPQVTVNGNKYALIENYHEGQTQKEMTGVVMYATVTGLTNGTYTIELYGAACLTAGRSGMTTDFEEGDANSLTAAYLYATPGGGETTKQYVPCLIESNMNNRGGEEAIPTATLTNIVVTDGTVQIGIYKEKGLTNWHFVQLKSVIATVSGDAAIAGLKSTAYDLLNDATYANVTGSERTNLQAAYDAEPAANTEEAYNAVISALNTAISAFETCNYAAYDAFVAEKAKAAALGMDVSGYTATSADDALAKTQTIMVDEYNYVTTNYPYAVDLGAWTTVNATERRGQHWDGTTDGTTGSPYSEQDKGWGDDSWSCSYSQDLLLPAGSYVFKVAGRKSSESAVLTLTVKNGETTLGTVNDFPNGDLGKGIDTSGATNFGEGTFANNGTGRGWQWRYVKFTLGEEATVNISVTANATAQQQWVGFCNATVQTDEEDNVELMEALVALNSAKAAATLTRRTANVGTGVFQISNTEESDLWDAYDDAKGQADDYKFTSSSTASEVNAIATALSTATTNYSDFLANPTLNAPAAGDVFNVMITTGDDYAFKNNPLTFNADNVSGAYFPQGVGVKAYKAQQITFTQVEGNKYTLSMVNADGNRVYIGTNKTINNTGEYTQIRLTTDGTKALAVKVEPTATAGVYKLWNTEAEALLGCQDNPAEKTTGGIFTTNSHSDFTITAAEKPSIPMTIDANVKYATRIFPFAPTLPDGVVAYSCAASADGELTLVEDNAPKANVPYILYAESGSTGSVSGFGSATETSYTEGWLTGVYEGTEATAGTYVLQNLDDKVAFYLVAVGEEPTVGAYRCYLSPSLEGRSAFFFPGSGEVVTGINAAVKALTSGKAQIFNASGAQIPALQKGMNIIRMEDGTTQKVMVE